MSQNLDPRILSKYGRLELIAKQVVEGFITGLHKSPFHGFSVEFAEHRLYNTGESTRHIDWKLFARTDKLFVKRYEEETNLRCHIVIDTSSSMYYPEPKVKFENLSLNKIDYCIYAAAALIEILKKQRDAFGLSLFDEELKLHSKAKSNTIHKKFVNEQLEKLLLEPIQSKKTAAAAALHTIAENIHKRSLVIIFSDMMDNTEKSDSLFSALKHFKHNQHEVILFHVMDDIKERAFNFPDGAYNFIDIETGEELKTHSSAVKKNYQESIEKYYKEVKTNCFQYGVEYVHVDINKGFYSILQSFLAKRSKML
jgi:uncharacterized protein (DUF58 family)